jgi:hypothetical protein
MTGLDLETVDKKKSFNTSLPLNTVPSTVLNSALSEEVLLIKLVEKDD